VFAFQGSGMIGGSSMTGVPFWIYAGSGIAIVGLILASLGFYMGSRRSTPKTVAGVQRGDVAAGGGNSASDSEVEGKDSR
jgi:hypothetical protein